MLLPRFETPRQASDRLLPPPEHGEREREIGMAVLRLAEITHVSLALSNMIEAYMSGTNTSILGGRDATCMSAQHERAETATESINDTLAAIGGIPILFETDGLKTPAAVRELLDITPADSTEPEWKIYDMHGADARVSLSIAEIRKDLMGH